MLVPGQVTKLAWDIGWTSIIFNKGHQVHVTIASTGAPISHFITDPGVAAINTIWHDAGHASRVILPVVR